MVKKGDIKDEHIRIYKDALKVAYSDDSLSDDGELMLEGLRNRYGISEDRHEELLVGVFAYLAEVNKANGELEDALNWYESLTEIDKHDEHAWREMAEIHTARNDYQLAGRALKKASKIAERAKKDSDFANKVNEKRSLYRKLREEKEDIREERRRRAERRRKRATVELIDETEEKGTLDMEGGDSFEIIAEETPPPPDFEITMDRKETEEPEEPPEPRPSKPKERKKESSGRKRARKAPKKRKKGKKRDGERRRPRGKEKRGKKGKKDEKPKKGKKKTSGKEKKSSMKCPKCSSTVVIPSDKRPIVVKCDNCGAKGKLLK